MRALSTLLVFLSLLTTSAFPADLSTLELAEWNRIIRDENWQVLIGSPKIEALGIFLDDAGRHDLNANSGMGIIDLEKCGVKLVRLNRTRFSSPFVPYEVTVSTEESRKMVPTIDAIMRANPNIKSVAITMENTAWSRLMTSDTTSALYKSVIWSDPAARAALIKCVMDNSTPLLTESKLTADITIQFLDSANKPIDHSNIKLNASDKNILEGSTEKDGISFVNKGVPLARRHAICVSGSIFFTNASGGVGEENCT